uniref:Uncharacterized protein n=1 Tax=Timema tahoe TaxID=61484 RepID=A0A7R9FHM0_9NEOP|nr:unnamed protein product [Timema tahoe]
MLTAGGGRHASSLKEGWLERRLGAGEPPVYVTRWFVLDHGVINAYRKPRKFFLVPLEVIPLNGAVAVNDLPTPREGRTSFAPPSCIFFLQYKNGRKITFRAPSVQERQEWQTAILRSSSSRLAYRHSATEHVYSSPMSNMSKSDPNMIIKTDYSKVRSQFRERLKSLVNSEENVLWAELPEVINSGVLANMDENQVKIEELKFQVITSEMAFNMELPELINLAKRSVSWDDPLPSFNRRIISVAVEKGCMGCLAKSRVTSHLAFYITSHSDKGEGDRNSNLKVAVFSSKYKLERALLPLHRLQTIRCLLQQIRLVLDASSNNHVENFRCKRMLTDITQLVDESYKILMLQNGLEYVQRLEKLITTSVQPLNEHSCLSLNNITLFRSTSSNTLDSTLRSHKKVAEKEPEHFKTWSRTRCLNKLPPTPQRLTEQQTSIIPTATSRLQVQTMSTQGEVQQTSKIREVKHSAGLFQRLKRSTSISSTQSSTSSASFLTSDDNTSLQKQTAHFNSHSMSEDDHRFSESSMKTAYQFETKTVHAEHSSAQLTEEMRKGLFSNSTDDPSSLTIVELDPNENKQEESLHKEPPPEINHAINSLVLSLHKDTTFKPSTSSSPIITEVGDDETKEEHQEKEDSKQIFQTSLPLTNVSNTLPDESSLLSSAFRKSANYITQTNKKKNIKHSSSIFYCDLPGTNPTNENIINSVQNVDKDDTEPNKTENFYSKTYMPLWLANSSKDLDESGKDIIPYDNQRIKDISPIGIKDFLGKSDDEIYNDFNSVSNVHIAEHRQQYVFQSVNNNVLNSSNSGGGNSHVLHRLTSSPSLNITSNMSSIAHGDGYEEVNSSSASYQHMAHNTPNSSVSYTSATLVTQHKVSRCQIFRTSFEEAPLYQHYIFSSLSSQTSDDTSPIISEPSSEYGELENHIYEEISPVAPELPPRPNNMLTLSHPKRLGNQHIRWCESEDVINSGLLDGLTKKERLFQESKFEIVTSEVSYLKSLCILENVFVQSPVLSQLSVFSEENKTLLFSNVKMVKECSEHFVQALMAEWENDLKLGKMSDLLHQFATSEFKIYVDYCTNQVHIKRIILDLMEEDKTFAEALSKLEADPTCQNFSLISFLTLPIQRVTRFALLVDGVMKYVPDTDQSLQQWKKTIAVLREMEAEGSNYSSLMASLVLTDSSQLTADGFENLPDQIMCIVQSATVAWGVFQDRTTVARRFQEA